MFRIDTISSESTTNSTDSELIHKICNVVYRMLTQVKRETANYKKLPQIIDFRDEDGNDRMQEEIQANYNRVKQEVQQIVEDEITRIKNDPELRYLIKDEN